MREVKQIIQDEMDYSLCKLLLDYLYFRKLIDEEKWIASTTPHANGYNDILGCLCEILVFQRL